MCVRGLLLQNPGAKKAQAVQAVQAVPLTNLGVHRHVDHRAHDVPYGWCGGGGKRVRGWDGSLRRHKRDVRHANCAMQNAPAVPTTTPKASLLGILAV